MEVIIVPSLTENNTYFIFRDAGREVKFTSNGNTVQCDELLTPAEMNFIRETILKPVRVTSQL